MQLKIHPINNSVCARTSEDIAKTATSDGRGRGGGSEDSNAVAVFNVLKYNTLVSRAFSRRRIGKITAVQEGTRGRKNRNTKTADWLAGEKTIRESQPRLQQIMLTRQSPTVNRRRTTD